MGRVAPARADDRIPLAAGLSNRVSLAVTLRRGSTNKRDEQPPSGRLAEAPTAGHLGAIFRPWEDEIDVSQSGLTAGDKSQTLISLGCLPLAPHSKVSQAWDFMMTLILLYVSLALPFEVAFLETPRGSRTWWINRVVDAVFFLDILMNFITPFQDKEKVWVRGTQRIAQHYLKTWFAIDMVSVFPFDIVDEFSSQSNLRSLNIVKTIKILRLVKMVRMLRISRLFSRWESAMEIDYRRLSLGKFAGAFLLTSHWMACLWHLTVEIERIAAGSEPLVTWVEHYPYFTGMSPAPLYIASLYWATVTMSTIGFGDILPVTDAERVYVIAASIVGAALYAYLVAAVCGIISRMDEEVQLFYQEMDQLNRFMRMRELPQALRVKLRDYLHFRWDQQQVQGASTDIIDGMSSTLVVQVYKHTHVPVLRSLYVFRSTSDEFLAALCSKFGVMHFGPEDCIFRAHKPCDCVHILERGIVMRAAKVLRSRTILGTDFLTSTGSSSAAVVCLTHAMTLTIHKEQYLRVIQDFPDMAAIIRSNVMKDKIREGLLEYARAIKKGLSMLADSTRTYTPRTMDMTFTKVQLEEIYAIKLDIQLSDPAIAGRLRHITCMLQRAARHGRIMRLVQSSLDTRSKYHAAVLAMESELQKLGLDSYMQMLVEDDHDLWTLSKCTAGDLKAAYRMPMGTAVRLIAAVQHRLLDEGVADQSAPVRASTRTVAHHVANAVLRLQDIASSKQEERQRRQRTTADDEQEQRDRERVITWAVDVLRPQKRGKAHSGRSSDGEGALQPAAMPAPVYRSLTDDGLSMSMSVVHGLDLMRSLTSEVSTARMGSSLPPLAESGSTQDTAGTSAPLHGHRVRLEPLASSRTYDATAAAQPGVSSSIPPELR